MHRVADHGGYLELRVVTKTMMETQSQRNTPKLRPSAKLHGPELRGLADFVPQMVWMCRPDGANIYFNRRWVDYTGMTLEESYGAGWNKPFHADDKDVALRAWNHAVQTGEQYQVESRIRSADGTYRWFLVRGEPIKEADGRIVKWFGTYTDIQDMKLAEQSLLRSEKLASVGRMAASVAHEINNPLEAVTNLLYLAKMTDDISSVHGYIDKAESELSRVAHITRQSLGFYREQNGPAFTSVQGLLKSAVELLKAKIVAKEATVETRWGTDAQISVVAGELRQVFANLLANSLDAIPFKGSVVIRTQMVRDQKSEARCFTITIADNGQGIQGHLRSQIFEPFFTTKGIVGTGLGLWVSKQIVDNHGGTIRVRSRFEGGQTGTVFRITLPIPTSTEESL